jgi:hypothetical protein
MYKVKWPDGRIQRVVVSPHATPGGMICAEEDGTLRFYADETAPCLRPHFNESVAGMGYSNVMKNRLKETRRSEATAWDDAHPEWAAWYARQPHRVE